MTLRTRRPIALALFSVAILSGCNAPGKPGPGPEVVRPEQVLDFPTLYSQNCSACHGANGQHGGALSLNNPNYLAIAGASNIVRITAAGVAGTAMPPFGKSFGGTLTDAQVKVIADGMLQAWGHPDSPLGQSTPGYAASSPGNPTQGQVAFSAFCAQCHGADAVGGEASPKNAIGSLVDPAYLALISDQGLRSFILAGQFDGVSHDWHSYQPQHPLSDQQTTDIVAWLAAHRTATPGQPYPQLP